MSWIKSTNEGLPKDLTEADFKNLLPGEFLIHKDNAAVDNFAFTMKQKMEQQRLKGYGGWDNKEICTTERLQQMLNECINKGDPVDVGNLAMMLWNRGESTAWQGQHDSQPAQPTKAQCSSCHNNNADDFSVNGDGIFVCDFCGHEALAQSDQNKDGS